MPRFRERPRPLDLDRATLRDLARVLAERLAQLDAFGHCPMCGDAGVQAFLTKRRNVTAVFGGREGLPGQAMMSQMIPA